jgi:ribosome biogenesis protein BRX1
MLKRRKNDAVEEITDESDAESSSSAGSEHVSQHARENSKILILSSRGINFRQRHLLNDFLNIIPHSVKESKFDSKSMLSELNELAELHGCTHCVFFEARKPQELFLWISQCPNGPSAKFHVQSIYTVDELKTTGNFTFGTRPLLFFDEGFASGNNQVLQQLLASVFNTPSGHRRGDRHAFFDHALNFSLLDGKIWVRQYQLCDGGQETKGDAADGLSLSEIGPRFVLNPIKIFGGSFRGKSVWENASYITPAASRVLQRRSEKGKHAQRQSANLGRLRRKEESHYVEDSELE